MRAKELRRILRCRVASALPEVLSRIPASWALAFGSGVGWCAYWVIPRDRRLARRNLGLVFPEASREHVTSMAKRGLMELGKNICDFVRYPRLSSTKREDLVTLEGLEELQDAVQEGRGAVVVTGHLGCWELIGAALAAKGFPIKGIARTLREERLERLLKDHRRSMGIETIDSQSPLGALRHLKGGGLLAILVDQRVPRGLWVDFLGQKTLVTDAAARVALAAQAPLFPVTIHRQGQRHRIRIGARLSPPHSRSEVSRTTQILATDLGNQILENPLEWMWIHPRWETPETMVSEPSSKMESVA